MTDERFTALLDLARAELAARDKQASLEAPSGVPEWLAKVTVSADDDDLRAWVA